MSDGYRARVPQRLRVVFVIVSVGVSVPVLAFDSTPLERSLAVVLIGIQAAALWWLDARPWLGTVSVLAVSAGLQWLSPGFGPGIAFVVLCTYAWMRPARESLWMLAPAAIAVCGPPVARGRWDLAGLWLAAVLLAWSWGALARARGERRQAERRQAVLEERARIARELHDVLSHTVSVMVVQAAAADDVFDANPQQAREALRRTEQAGREALAELRWFLRSVRDEGDDPGPQPTLADVDRLAGTMGESGLPVTVRREGDGAVPLGVQLGAYRIVQEALTNTLRHAGASRAEVLLRVDEAEVFVRIRDNGGGAAANGKGGGGHGLTGMRERAELLGGTLLAEPGTDGGFEVSAHLPLRAAG
ncbi:sensor histidine kinase [Paractinoplanes toevensis]|uniref:histidine kinase n=1 Tax=Paractinoplanes toevensis TaxID=571911 RepID=A0A919W8K6_9ACTN|nr:histidine kinase [Actinoplanes toevensis]GIM94356.1 two-component sensor histidine kinase [Actinoplanes toevensis]